MQALFKPSKVKACIVFAVKLQGETMEASGGEIGHLRPGGPLKGTPALWKAVPHQKCELGTVKCPRRIQMKPVLPVADDCGTRVLLRAIQRVPGGMTRSRGRYAGLLEEIGVCIPKYPGDWMPNWPYDNPSHSRDDEGGFLIPERPMLALGQDGRRAIRLLL